MVWALQAIGELGARYVRVQHSPAKPRHSLAIFPPDPDSGRRLPRAAVVIVSIVIAWDARIESEVFARRANPTPARKLTYVARRVFKKLGEFSIEASFTSEGRVTAVRRHKERAKTRDQHLMPGC